MEDYRPWLKPLKIGGPTNCRHKVFVPTNYASDSSGIQRARASVSFAGLKNSLNIAAALIIGKTKLMELPMLMLMLCHVFPQKRQGKEEDLQAQNIQTLCQLRQHLGHLFLESNLSTPSFYLRSVRLPSAPSIWEMHSKRKHPSQKSGRKCLMAKRVSWTKSCASPRPVLHS